MKNRFVIGVFSVLIILALNTLSSFASPMSKMKGMKGMNKTETVEVTEADRNAFKELWEKAQAEFAFTAEQTGRLATELEEVAKKLTENYKVLIEFLAKKEKAKKNEAAKIDKRIDIVEAERDLLAAQAKLKLSEFLSEEQRDLVFTAGFHGISMNLSGEEHLQGMQNNKLQNMESKEKMETKEQPDTEENMDTKKRLIIELGKSAEKLNQNCEAVTLELIRSSLATVTPESDVEM